MDAFLEPLHQFRNTPIKLHVGSCHSTPIKFIPVLFAFISDTKEANDVVGVKGAPSCVKRCRMCNTSDLMRCTYKDDSTRRVDSVMESMQRRGQEDWIALMIGTKLSPAQKKSLE